MKRVKIKTLLVVTALLLATGCSIQPWVKPYERQNLADPIMSFSQYPLDSGFLNHMYQSREGAKGGEGGAGGGCGCN